MVGDMELYAIFICYVRILHYADNLLSTLGMSFAPF